MTLDECHLPDVPVVAIGTSGGPDVPVETPDDPMLPWKFGSPNQNLSKSCSNFTKLFTSYPNPIPKLFPKDNLKKIMGLAGISNLVKRGKLGQERPKLTNDLLVANL